MPAMVLALLSLAAMLLARRGRARERRHRARRVLSRLCFGVAAAAATVSAGGARAATGPRLSYTQGPAECLSEVDFRREVAIAGENDGVDRFDDQGAATVRVSFAQLPAGRYRGELRYTDAAGNTSDPKVRTHANCEILGRWVAADAYYYLPQEEELPELPAPPPPPPVPAPPPAPPPPAALPPARPAAPEPQRPIVIVRRPFLCRILNVELCMDLTLSLMAMGILSLGYPSDVGGGFGLGVEVRGQWLSLGFQFRGLPPVSVRTTEPIDPSQPSREVVFDTSLWTGQLVPCVRYKFLMGCAVGEFGGQTHQTGLGEFGVVAHAAFGPRAGVDFEIDDRVSLFAFGEALFAALRGAAYYYGPPPDDLEGPPTNAVWREPIVAGFLAAGVSVHFK